MSYPIFYVPAGDVLPILFASYDKDDGSSITLTGLAVTDIEIFKDGGTTQRASDAGYTLLDTDGIDFDGITGIHGFSIDTGDNTDPGFYTVGAWFHVVVSAVTIDSVAVSFIAAAFRLMKAEGVAGVPKADVDAWLGTVAATPTTAGVPEVDVTHWLGTAAQGASGRPQVDVELIEGADPSDTIRDSIVDDATRIDASALNTASGAIGSNGSGLTEAGGDGDHLTAINLPDQTMNITGNVTGNLSGSVGSVTGAVGSVTGNVGGNVAGSVGSLATQAKADVNAEADQALSDYDPPTRAELTSDVNSIIAYLDGLVIAKGTIGDTGNSTTDLHLEGLTYGNDEINNYLLAIKDVSAGEWHARYIEDWADTGDLATVATLPFTPENDVDTYVVLAFRQDVTGGSGLDAAGVRAAIGLAAANLDTQLGDLPTAVEIVNEWETQSQADPTGFHVNVMEQAGTAQTANDDGADINTLITEMAKIPKSDSNVTWNATAAAQIQTEANDALVANKLDHLVAVADADDPVDNSIVAKLAAKGATADWSDYNNTTDSQEALRDRGDAAWATATGFSTLDAAGVRSALGMASANLDTQLGDLPTAAENFTAVLTSALTEAYAADGAAPTLAQAIFLIMQRLTEFAISSTTVTIKKLNGSDTAATLTLDDADSPTSSTRSS